MRLTRELLIVCLLAALARPIEAAGDGAVVQAARAGEWQTVRSLVQSHADVNAPAADGTTALHWAAHLGNLDIVDLLIRGGARVSAANRYGATSLALACENGDAAVVNRLLDGGADPNEANGEGETALMIAARTGQADAVRVLLARGARVNAAESWRKQTALMWAAAENNTAVARLLLEAGADLKARSSGGFTPLLFAVRSGHIAAAELLTDAGADVKETLPDGTGVMVMAVTNAHYELAARLLKRGANPNAADQGWTALHQLAWTRRPNRGFANPGPSPTGTLDGLALVKELVAGGADPNARQTKEPRDGYRNLLNRVGATPFLLAAKSADVELMRALVAAGANPTLTTSDRTTPLMAAAGVGIWAVGESPGTNEEALKAVQLAVELGGEVTAVNDYGYTALHGAAHRGAPALVQYLVDRGARLDAPLTKSGGGGVGWKEGWTPLAIAEGLFYANSYKRHPETAALLRRLIDERSGPPASSRRE
jgi:ankyrin repeat protein